MGRGASVLIGGGAPFDDGPAWEVLAGLRLDVDFDLGLDLRFGSRAVAVHGGIDVGASAGRG